ncbi:hypothetical protein [Neisseria sp.]|uniref:hypothetical protein n=1 Tax=Neisseria sp. TaxID=192066 RepID=UPI00359FEB9E
MITDPKPNIRSTKVNPSFIPPPDDYPHYRLIPLKDADSNYCLLFYVSVEHYLMLCPKVKRYAAIKKLEQFGQTAPFRIFEWIP